MLLFCCADATFEQEFVERDARSSLTVLMPSAWTLMFCFCLIRNDGYHGNISLLVTIRVFHVVSKIGENAVREPRPNNDRWYRLR